MKTTVKITINIFQNTRSPKKFFTEKFPARKKICGKISRKFCKNFKIFTECCCNPKNIKNVKIGDGFFSSLTLSRCESYYLMCAVVNGYLLLTKTVSAAGAVNKSSTIMLGHTADLMTDAIRESKMCKIYGEGSLL